MPGLSLGLPILLLVNPYDRPVADTGQVSIQLWFRGVFLDNQKHFISQTLLQLDKRPLAESQPKRDKQK